MEPSLRIGVFRMSNEEIYSMKTKTYKRFDAAARLLHEGMQK